MCGIAAIICGDNPRESLNRDIVAMLDVIRHRGPDDEGVALFNGAGRAPKLFGGVDTPDDVYNSSIPFAPSYHHDTSQGISGNVALGHRRLSILDLSAAGHQPMCTEDKRYWITYNGEIYNYLEIKQELEELGYEFYSHTDTEVIINAYMQWGSECLHRFNGMFSFVIYDNLKSSLFIARDRFGIKPLYYWQSPKGFVAFASEIKQFTVLPGWKALMNGSPTHDFLTLGVTNHSSETLFRGVMMVPPGSCFEGQLADIERLPSLIEQWYALTPKKTDESFESACKTFKELLQDSVRLRLRADVDVGSCLSGGLDSSSIVCLSHLLLKDGDYLGDHKTFSACSTEAKYDEKMFIDIVVESTKVKGYYTYPSANGVIEAMSDLTWQHDEPFGSTSVFAQWQVFKLAKDNGMKVMLDGQGADELLNGYLSFFGNRFYDLLTSMQWRQLLTDVRETKRVHSHLKPWELLAGHVIPWQLKRKLKQLMGRHPDKPHWINFNALQSNSTLASALHSAKTTKAKSELQLCRTNLPMLLHFEDRNSMAHSIESRTPFLDYRLVEYVLGLPTEYKISKGVTKRVLRKGLEGVLPKRISERHDKIAFATPEEVWLKRGNPNYFRQQIREAIDLSQGVLRESAMDEVERRIEGKTAFCFLPWRLLSFGQWIKTFSVEV